MAKNRLPAAVCAVVGEVLRGSHPTLDALFLAAGAPGPPPALPHGTKWKTWLLQASNDPKVDSLALLGNVIEEFMDLPPKPGKVVNEFGSEEDAVAYYKRKRERLEKVLEEHGLRYFSGGRILPQGEPPPTVTSTAQNGKAPESGPRKPSSLDELLRTIIRGLPRAMHPLTHRRRGATPLTFDSEYDIQDLLHSQLRPWVSDIRPEEGGPSLAGSNTRMDFLLPKHSLVIETKRVRDRAHAKKIGDELIIDIEHYRKHPNCKRLLCVIYDPYHLIPNPQGLVSDLAGKKGADGSLEVQIEIISG